MLVPLAVAVQLDLMQLGRWRLSIAPPLLSRPNRYGADNYGPPERMLAGFAFVSLILALALWRWDVTIGGGVLLDPTKVT